MAPDVQRLELAFRGLSDEEEETGADPYEEEGFDVDEKVDDEEKFDEEGLIE